MRRFHSLFNDALRRLCDERGQAYAELVIVLPLILLLVSGSLFFGRALYVALERSIRRSRFFMREVYHAPGLPSPVKREKVSRGTHDG